VIDEAFMNNVKVPAYFQLHNVLFNNASKAIITHVVRPYLIILIIVVNEIQQDFTRAEV
jgi:hypothetical protein